MENNEWLLSTLNEKCVQKAINEYLGNFPYADGFTPSQRDIELHKNFNCLKSDFSKLPHLKRWFNHLETFNDHERSRFRVDLQFHCKSNKINYGFQVCK